jgi:hypothetical protein
MKQHEIGQSLVQVEAGIELLNGQGFQAKVNIHLPPFGPQEAKAKLDAIWINPLATDEQRAKAAQLREWLWEKCKV